MYNSIKSLRHRPTRSIFRIVSAATVRQQQRGLVVHPTRRYVTSTATTTTSVCNPLLLSPWHSRDQERRGVQTRIEPSLQCPGTATATWHGGQLQPQQLNNTRLFSTNANNKKKDLPVKILYASQGGTAQIFAMQLSEALEELEVDVSIQGLHEDSPTNLLQPGEALYVFLASTTGVGEPPDNARQFYEWLSTANEGVLEGVDFCVFGLGNQKAHPNHYNVIGKGLDDKLAALGATRIYQLGLGDDGDCIEDDYDTWMEGFIHKIYHQSSEEEEEDDDDSNDDDTLAKDAEDDVITASSSESTAAAAVVEDPTVTLEPCKGGAKSGGKRLISTKYPRLQLTPSGTNVTRNDMFHLSQAFYLEHTQTLPVVTNRPLNTHAEENGLYEMRVGLPENITYETGDHLMVYPQNSQAMMEGFLQYLDVDPHVMIEAAPKDNPESRPYPHPTGITLAETLRHCVDLSAVPSPNVSRLLLGKQQIDYKNDIATPRRTVLDLLLASTDAPRKFALEEILYNLPPMKPRYYSIASSSLVHPNEVYLVYRPVQYTTTLGQLRTGVCTSYLKNMMGQTDHDLDDYNTSDTTVSSSSQLIAAVNSNPTFRLPEDRSTPVLFIAGGCGIAPIRAFLEERMHTGLLVAGNSRRNPFGEGYLFLGFRSPGDAPYKSLVQKAFASGAISNVYMTYNAGCKGVDSSKLEEEGLGVHTSCGLVSDAVGEHGEQLYSFFERGGHTYICGGARLFGVAIENQVHLLLQKQGNLSENEATQYLQRMLEEGRFNEDLSD